ncbi:MAG: Re/Si-specific NAD(P)(+) transhydrogenase subunit alpha [Dehalococcoidia bacterium]|nr:Re/Si-specific NAD(P)(+) transhydrogenase subunit alpha [Dehalococcoidia bacterium]
MRVGVPKETAEGERRVALTPNATSRLVNGGIEVVVESGAGDGSFFSDAEYQEAGASTAPSAFESVDLVVAVRKPDIVTSLAAGTALAAMIQPLVDHAAVRSLAEAGVTSFSMDTIPRIARAQSMDVLSSMASLAGYKAAIIAADALGKLFPMMMAASGTTPPAKGLVLGAGVAGLQAIATARRLGAVLSGYDVRPVVREQVESLGATFLEIELDEEAEDTGGYARELSEEARRKGQELVHSAVQDMDFVITTAAIPGRPAPKLIDAGMVRDMQPGAVIVDLAAESGGNCELTKPGETVVENGVTIVGPLNLPSSMPTHASQMYARNMLNFINHTTKDGDLIIDTEDEITKGCLITHGGDIVHEATAAAMKANGG